MMLTNPKDFIDYYVNILKNDYKFNDLKINYHGFVGFIMNLFAWTNYDLKQYHDYLFKEGFLATSEENKNIYLHSSKYGYTINYAKASTVNGTFTLDMSDFPRKLTNVYRREVTLPSPLIIKIGNYTFQTDSKYVFIEEGVAGEEKYYCQITSDNDRHRLVSSASTIIKVPIYNLQQYEVTSYTKVIPNYDYSDYFPYNIVISNIDQISDLVVRIKRVGEVNYEKYNISRVKSFDTSISKSVYLTQKSDKLYVIETGNGYHGVHIPGATMTVDVQFTKASTANSLARQNGTASGEMTVVGFDSSNIIVESSGGSQPFSETNFIVDAYSVDGGVDILTDSELKNDVVRWVQSRDNLINEKDFFNNFESYIKDFDVVFKKSQFIDNNFYLCRTLRDQYKNILYTTNHTYKCLDYQNDVIKNLSITVLDDFTGSTLEIGRCNYKITAVDKFYRAIPSDSIDATVINSGQAISLIWDVVPEAEYYKIFGRTHNYNNYWTVDKDHVDIDGKVYFIDTGTTGTSENCGTRSETIEQINFPEFTVDLSETFDLTDSFYDWNLYESDNTSVTYYINNKNFVFQPESITILKDTVIKTLIKILTPRLDQIVENSWVIINERLYICVTNTFNPSINTVTMLYNKDVTLISPFVYKYNDFFDWFEGYFLYDNIVEYPIISEVAVGVTPPISHINIVFNKETGISTIYIRSYQTIDSTYIFNIKINSLHANYVDVTYNEEQDLYYYEFDGFLTDETDIIIDCYLASDLQFRATTKVFRQTYKIDDQLVLIKYISEDNRTYIGNIPLLSYKRPTALEVEYEDPDYINTQIFDFIANSNIKSNRIMSDSVQTRFLNTTFCESYFSKKVLTQQYDSNLILPLNISINIKYKDSTTDFTESYKDIELLVATYLQNNATGVAIKFYNSQIVDLIHNYSDLISSVYVDVCDSYGTPLNEGIEVVQSDQLLPEIMDKLMMLKFVRMYWWWNLNNIKITQSV
jgi:hypothetical protein